MELLRWVGFPPRKRATRGFGVRVCSFRVYRRQTFPYQIMEEFPVIRPECEVPLIRRSEAPAVWGNNSIGRVKSHTHRHGRSGRQRHRVHRRNHDAERDGRLAGTVTLGRRLHLREFCSSAVQFVMTIRGLVCSFHVLRFTRKRFPSRVTS
jgi:hypothetical protein